MFEDSNTLFDIKNCEENIDAFSLIVIESDRISLQQLKIAV